MLEASAASKLLSPANHGGGEAIVQVCPQFQQPRASTPHHNSNVLNILPVTTLRTIDLEGKKNSGPLFSRFCGKLSVFFQGTYAPKLVQSA
jgi:hypothetical protein